MVDDFTSCVDCMVCPQSFKEKLLRSERVGCTHFGCDNDASASVLCRFSKSLLLTVHDAADAPTKTLLPQMQRLFLRKSFTYF